MRRAGRPQPRLRGTRERSPTTRSASRPSSSTRCASHPLERVNREIGRCTDVVGIFPDDASLIRLVSMLAIEANDEWLVGPSYINQKSMALSARASQRRISLQIKTRRSSSSRPEPPPSSPTT